ncbi:MAG: peptidoglycan recognition family protein [Planctomycetota bacterium]|nr:peptidoglycan recognition family protein [Planctomycetota bacterium]
MHPAQEEVTVASNQPHDPPLDPIPIESPGHDHGRRLVLLAGLGLLAGCSTPRTRTALPQPEWPDASTLAVEGTPVPAPARPDAGSRSPVVARSYWAKGGPIVSRINPMGTPNRITIHHDGMPPFAATSKGEVARRIEVIRRAHLNRDGGGRWGDIGYHFVVDRAGRAWEARSLRYQGAHVKNQNECNIGILCLGNFEEQIPSRDQVRGLELLVVDLRTRFRIPTARVRTHRELSSTLCPGRHLQDAVNSSRAARRFV